MIKSEEFPWFEEWFNTPFYHDLYRHRDDQEAYRWIEKIMEIIPLQKGLPLLDICCGNGRHALHFEKKGWKACGIDISPKNIAFAQSQSSHPDHWRVEDAKEFRWNEPFQLVTNLFTSFGYFDDTKENEKMLQNIFDHAGPSGYVVIDFFNAPQVVSNLKPTERVAGVLTEYKIEREIVHQQIIKNIQFEFDNQSFHFQEKVYLYEPSDFVRWGEKLNFRLCHHFGDYKAQDYHSDAPRSIFVFQRKG